MQRDMPTVRLAEQLLLFTYMTIQAVEGERHDELESLFAWRQGIIDQLVSRPLDKEAAEMMDRVKVAESSLKRSIELSMADAVKNIHGLFIEKRGMKAYKHAA